VPARDANPFGVRPSEWLLAKRAYIALGSNLGEREANLLAAIEQLESLGIGRLCAMSSLYETAARYVEDQPDFVNAVAAIDTLLSPEQLLSKLLDLEVALGRDRLTGLRYGPRTLDLDLLLMGDQICDSELLTLPHPRMQERRFVLEPLCEIAPQLVHPILQLSMASLLAQCADQTPPRRLPPFLGNRGE